VENFGCGAQVGVVFQRGLDLHFVTDQQKAEAFMAVARKCCARDHHANAFIAAHRINRDTRRLGHGYFPLFVERTGAAGLSGGNNLAAIVVATRIAHMVRTLQFAAVRAFLKGFDLQRIVATTHAALGRRSFSLGDSHLGTCSISKNIMFLRL
jgi:hypothetical protein